MTGLLTANDVRAVRFTGRTALFGRREWYAAGEVDDLLDMVEVTLTELGRELARLRETQRERPDNDKTIEDFLGRSEL